MTTYFVRCNGGLVAEKKTRREAESYIDLQLRKLKGGGVADRPIAKGDKSGAWASQQEWTIQVIDDK